MKKIILSTSTFVLLSGTSLFAGAVAGVPQTIHSGETVKLDGSESFPEYGGYIKRYKWVQVENGKVIKSFKGKGAFLKLTLASKFGKKVRFDLITEEITPNATIITKDTTFVKVIGK